MTPLTSLIAWAAKNERLLGAALFTFGFITDLFTYTLLPVKLATIAFASYLVLAAIAMLGAHVTYTWHETEDRIKKGVAVLCPLVALYALGNLFSGFVVFYAKNSVIGVSWPFLIILLLLYGSSEYFRMYKQYLIFQTTLFFFALYAFAVFALPLVTGTIGPWTFAGSTAATVGIFGLFLLVLWVLNHARFKESARGILFSSGTVLAVIVVFYIADFIPPIPLAIKEAAVYHSLVHEADGYHVRGEAPEPWWHLGLETVSYVPGETLYVYSAVAAPGNLTGTIVHRWERYDMQTHDWTTVSKISFPINGGREGGYRGYSEKGNLTPGKWRVSIETPGGQIVGRLRFDIQNADSAPALVDHVL